MTFPAQVNERMRGEGAFVTAPADWGKFGKFRKVVLKNQRNTKQKQITLNLTPPNKHCGYFGLLAPPICARQF